MGGSDVRFSAVVLASLAGVVGVKYLVGSMLAVLSNWREPATIPAVEPSPLVLGESFVATMVCGILLLCVAGGFLTGIRSVRIWSIVTFVVVIGLSIPSILAVDLIITAEAVAFAGATLYLLRHNPVARTGRNPVDESDSASRLGSTLR